MARNRIPDRDPIRDTFNGVLLLVDGVYLLSAQAVPGVNIAAEGELVLRYGVRFLEKHHRSIVPGLLALDYGDILTGERAWELIYKRGQRYPRADVIGYTDQGEDEMLPLKTLDIDVGPQVLAYADAEATKPFGEVAALIVPDDANVVPRLDEYLPRFTTLEAWRAAANQNDSNNTESDTP